MWLPAAYRDGVVLEVHVQTGARAPGVASLTEGTLKVRVSSAPVEGKANAELIKLLSTFFEVPRSKIEIVGGKSSRRKRVYVGSTTPKSALAKLRDGGLVW